MKKVISSILIILSMGMYGQEPNQSETPFIKAENESGAPVDVPLQSISAEVKIAGVIAEVTSKQVYFNSSEKPVNAQYIFPCSTKAAVYAMTMKIGDRLIVAKIKEKKEAKQQFEEAVQKGKTASLLQQHRPNVFQMDLGNIPPLTRVEIALKYTEFIESEDGVYQFVYPTIVGKRYDKEVEGSESWSLNPYANLDQGEEPNVKLPEFNIQVTLRTPLPIHGLNIISHQSEINYLGRKEANVILNNGQKTENKDFILQYRLKGEKVETGMMLWEGEKENFFLFMGESPKRVVPDEIPPREYFFIVDVSGSMNGFPLNISKMLMREILNDLRPQDKFNVLLFAASSQVLFKSPQTASRANISNAISFIDGSSGSGGTHLLSALQDAFSYVDQNSSSAFVILTDGFVTVEKKAFDFISNNLHKASFYPIGIGASVNRHLIEGIAHFGRTEPFIITKPEQGKKTAKRFKEYVSAPVLTNIDVVFDGLETYDVIPASVPDLLGDRPVTVFGKWKGTPKGEVLLTGISATGKYTYTTKVKKNQGDEKNMSLMYLWARNKLKTLSDYNTLSHTDEYKNEIKKIGLKYSLLSEYTSFLAIDEDKQVVEQKPLIPHNPGAVPEPHEWAIIILSAAFLAFSFLKSRFFS